MEVELCLHEKAFGWGSFTWLLLFFRCILYMMGLSKLEVCMEMGEFSREFEVILAFLCPCMAFVSSLHEIAWLRLSCIVAW